MRIRDAITGLGSSNPVALDISPARIKLLALSGKPGSYRIDSYAVESLPEGAFNDQQIADPGAIGPAIQKAMKTASCHAKKAIIAVSGATVISKTIYMPATLSEDEIEEQLNYETDVHIPYPIEEVRLDFQVLGPAKWDNGVQAVLLAACRRETVDLYVEALKIASLDPAVVDVEPYAVQNACSLVVDKLSGGGAGETVAVVKLSGYSIVNVLRDGETVYTREESFGIGHLIKKFQHYGGFSSMQETLTHCRSRGFDSAFLERELPQFAQQAAEQIDRSLQLFFSSSSEADQINRILLAGGGALVPGLDRHIASELSIPVEPANPLAGMNIGAAARGTGIESDAPSLMVATGLALRAFD